ncbi:MAG: isopentenyl-diphosphate Delta-isomerase [Phycisphaerae bacterium]
MSHDTHHVVLVDHNDRPIGVEDKRRAHAAGGRLHRAFSVFIFDAHARLLLQRRAATKYHFAGRWSNTCCSHAQPDEPLIQTARRRLTVEMGFDVPLHHAGSFLYTATDAATGLTEREYDHVFTGRFDAAPQPNPDEVDAWSWVALPHLTRDLAEHADRYTPWLAIALARLPIQTIATERV